MNEDISLGMEWKMSEPSEGPYRMTLDTIGFNLKRQVLWNGNKSLCSLPLERAKDAVEWGNNGYAQGRQSMQAEVEELKRKDRATLEEYGRRCDEITELNVELKQANQRREKLKVMADEIMKKAEELKNERDLWRTEWESISETAKVLQDKLNLANERWEKVKLFEEFLTSWHGQGDLSSVQARTLEEVIKPLRAVLEKLP